MTNTNATVQQDSAKAPNDIEELLKNTEALLGGSTETTEKRGIEKTVQELNGMNVRSINYGTFTDKVSEIESSRSKVLAYVELNMKERDAERKEEWKEVIEKIPEEKNLSNLWGALWYIRGRKEMNISNQVPIIYWIDPVTKERVKGPGMVRPKVTKEQAGRALRDLTREYVNNLKHVNGSELAKLRDSISQLKEYMVGQTASYRQSYFENSRRYDESKKKMVQLEEILDKWNEKVRNTGFDDENIEEYETKRDNVELKLQETKSDLTNYATEAIQDRLFHRYLKVQTKLIQGTNDAVNKYMNMISSFVAKVEVELKIGDSMESLVDCMVIGGKMIHKIQEAEEVLTEYGVNSMKMAENIPGIVEAYSTKPEYMEREIEKYESKMVEVEKSFEKELNEKMDMLDRIQKER